MTPKKPGFYWYKTAGSLTVVQITKPASWCGYPPGTLLVWFPGGVTDTVKNLKCEWLGEVKPPKQKRKS
jgi:hypothetical protein